MAERSEKCPTCGTWTMRFDPPLELEVEEEATALVELHQRAEKAEAQVARIRAFLEDMAGWCSPHGVAADYSRRGLDALDGVDPLGLAGPTREEVPVVLAEPECPYDYHEMVDEGITCVCQPHGIGDAYGCPEGCPTHNPAGEDVPEGAIGGPATDDEADDGFRWHPLSECPDETACPIHGRNEGEPTGPEDLPELTRENALELVDELGLQAFRAEDRLAFVREMCDAADRDVKPITTEQVRAWTQYAGCGGAIELTKQQADTLAADLLAGRVKRRKARIIDAGSYPAKPGRATMAADRCPQCGGDNTEAWAPCGTCDATGEQR